MNARRDLASVALDRWRRAGDTATGSDAWLMRTYLPCMGCPDALADEFYGTDLRSSSLRRDVEGGSRETRRAV